MSESADSRGGGVATRPGLTGMRAAMYAEMAKAAGGERPPFDRDDDWTAALSAALDFIRISGFDERASRQLLSEAFATRRAGRRRQWETAVEETCRRLAMEFRRQVRSF